MVSRTLFLPFQTIPRRGSLERSLSGRLYGPLHEMSLYNVGSWTTFPQVPTLFLWRMRNYDYQSHSSSWVQDLFGGHIVHGLRHLRWVLSSRVTTYTLRMSFSDGVLRVTLKKDEDRGRSRQMTKRESIVDRFIFVNVPSGDNSVSFITSTQTLTLYLTIDR